MPRPGSHQVTSIVVAGPNHGLTVPVHPADSITCEAASTRCTCGDHNRQAVRSVSTACAIEAGAATEWVDRITAATVGRALRPRPPWRTIASVEASTRAHGPLPAAEVWERYADPHRWASWAPQIRRVDTAATRIAPGVTGTVHGPLGLRIRFTVTDVDEAARTWAWDVTPSVPPLPLHLHLRHGVELHPTGSATWLAVRGPAPIVAAYLPIARIALEFLLR